MLWWEGSTNPAQSVSVHLTYNNNSVNTQGQTQQSANTNGGDFASVIDSLIPQPHFSFLLLVFCILLPISLLPPPPFYFSPAY